MVSTATSATLTTLCPAPAAGPRPTPPTLAPPPPILRALDGLGTTTVSIAVHVDGLGEVVEVGGDRPVVPASNQKLWTAAGVHLLLPADFTFTTRLFATGPIARGTLAGDLVVVGGGDPTLTTKGATHSLDALAARLRQMGVERVTGRLIVDESRWDRTRTPSGWEPWQLEFVGPLSAFMVDWNNLRKDVAFMDDPALENGRSFVERLALAGIRVDGGAAVGTLARGAELLHTETAGDRTKLLTFMLSESDNMMAEAFVREIGLRERGSATHRAGLDAIGQAIGRGLCLTDDGVNDDGSGVSHHSRHSARYIRQLLAVLPELRSELGVAGQTGTMKARLRSVAGRVHAKTGTVRGARALSGYATTAAGRTMTFSILVNGDDTKLTSKSLDDLVEALLLTY